MTPPPPTDPDLARATEEFKSGGWVMSLLGGAGMVARMLLNDEHHPVIFWIRKFTAGAIIGVIVYFGLHGSSLSELHKGLIMSTAGAASPEIAERIRRKFASGSFNENEGKGSKKNKKRS